MKIVIIGSGNVATVLGTKLLQGGHEIVQVISRKDTHASRLAKELSAAWSTDLSAVNREAEFYLVALSDDALYELGAELSLPDKLVAHTAGIVPKEVLLKVSPHSGVFYPLQSLRREIRPFPEIPILVDANGPGDSGRLITLARTISSQVREADNAEREKLHLAAVLVNNFTNFLYTQAAGYCEMEKTDFSLLLPLIKETADRLAHFTPGEVQTGPAVRGDRRTIEKHRELLSNYPDIKDFYSLFTNKIEEFYRSPKTPSL